jgi:hypothetical protein
LLVVSRAASHAGERIDLPVIPEADALAEAIRDLRRVQSVRQIPDSLACVSASGMTGESIGSPEHYLMACGLMGEPVAPGITSGAPQKKNS